MTKGLDHMARMTAARARSADELPTTKATYAQSTFHMGHSSAVENSYGCGAWREVSGKLST